jgi:hypothetical protein
MEKMKEKINGERLTTEQASKVLGFAPITLKVWRGKGIGPPFVRVGRRIYYILADLLEFAERNHVDYNKGAA